MVRIPGFPCALYSVLPAIVLELQRTYGTIRPASARPTDSRTIVRLDAGDES